MSPEFRSHQHNGSAYGDTWVFPLGPASSDIMGRAFDRVFQLTLPVESLPPNEAVPAKVSAVIEPRIEGFAFQLPFVKTGTYSSNITYRFILYSKDGTPFASWVVEGVGAQPGQFGFDFVRWPGEATDLAIKDAANKFIQGIGQVPEVRRWLLESEQQISQARLVWVEELAIR